MFRIIVLLILLFAGTCSPAQAGGEGNSQPIIDMHVHAYPADWVRNVLGVRAAPSKRLPDPPNPITGKRSGATTDAQLRSTILTAMKQYHIVKAVASGPLEIVYQWKDAAPDVVIGSPLFPIPRLAPYPSVDELRAGYGSRRLGALGEVTAIYDGFSPSDMKFDEYYRLAEQMGIPVGIHTGIGIPEASYDCCPGFRIALANPLNVEDLLVRHPKLKVYIMHAGYPYLDATLALMNAYPAVYADLAAIDWLLPQAEFQDYLRQLVRAGMGKRLMFGTDEIVWPDAFGVAIDNINSADFLTPAEKSDIFYDNAARFLGLEKSAGKGPGK
jgi:predicted TIM-barrel fold metal-dependent hydrolase